VDAHGFECSRPTDCAQHFALYSQRLCHGLASGYGCVMLVYVLNDVHAQCAPDPLRL
jgi:hypothetical protein